MQNKKIGGAGRYSRLRVGNRADLSLLFRCRLRREKPRIGRFVVRRLLLRRNFGKYAFGRFRLRKRLRKRKNRREKRSRFGGNYRFRREYGGGTNAVRRRCFNAYFRRHGRRRHNSAPRGVLCGRAVDLCFRYSRR